MPSPLPLRGVVLTGIHHPLLRNEPYTSTFKNIIQIHAYKYYMSMDLYYILELTETQENSTNLS